MNILHLFILLVSATTVGVVGASTAKFVGVPDIPADYRWSGAAIALVVVALFLAATLSLAWIVCRRFHIHPMSLSMPPCPHCGKAAESYRVVERAWPRRVLACSLCGGSVELWLQRRVKHSEVSHQIPSFRLKWPQFVGLWKRQSPVQKKEFK